jgi:arylsulfatase A-like enzyme
MIGGMDSMHHLMNLIQQYDGSTVFTNAFAHTPICCPSHSSILTGQCIHNGQYINNSISGNCNGILWQQYSE